MCAVEVFSHPNRPERRPVGNDTAPDPDAATRGTSQGRRPEGVKRHSLDCTHRSSFGGCASETGLIVTESEQQSTNIEFQYQIVLSTQDFFRSFVSQHDEPPEIDQAS